MLHGLAAMRLRMRDRGDDAGLRIGPAHAFDAGALAQARALAVGGDKRGRFRSLCRAERDHDAKGVGAIVSSTVSGSEDCDGVGSRTASASARRRSPFSTMKARSPRLSSSSKPSRCGTQLSRSARCR